MVKGRRKGVGNQLFAFIVACGVCGGAFAFAAGFGVDPFSQVAVGAAANAMCKGGADAKCPCGTGMKAGKCDPSVKGGGKIGCPCGDKTSGDEAASGKCASVGICGADKADGMMPMLPMLPMIPMMMPMMPMPQDPCLQPGAGGVTNTTGATAATSTASTTPASTSNPNCPGGMSSYGTQEAGGFWSSVWDTTNPFSGSGGSSTTSSNSSSKSATVWSNLLNSLGISNQTGTANQTQSTQKAVTYTATSTGGLSAKGGSGSGVNTQNTTEFSGSGSTFSYVDLTSPTSQTVLTQMKTTLQNILDIVRKMF